MNTYRITMVETEEGVAAWCDDLPGCCSQGATRAEAEENIRSAIREYRQAQAEVETEFAGRIVHETIMV